MWCRGLLAVLFVIAFSAVEGRRVKRDSTEKLTPLKVEKCGGDDHTFHLNGLSLSPYPIDIKRNLSFNIDMEMEHVVVGPFDVQVDVWKDLFFWMPIPCKLIPCHYRNLCQHPEGTDPQKDIQKVFGFPIQGCVIPKFKLNLTVNDIRLPDLGKWIEGLLGYAGGNYQVEARIRNSEKLLACIRIFLRLDVDLNPFNNKKKKK